MRAASILHRNDNVNNRTSISDGTSRSVWLEKASRCEQKQSREKNEFKIVHIKAMMVGSLIYGLFLLFILWASVKLRLLFSSTLSLSSLCENARDRVVTLNSNVYYLCSHKRWKIIVMRNVRGKVKCSKPRPKRFKQHEIRLKYV